MGYMANHQHDNNANNLWSYFQNVLNWAITNFDTNRFKKIMKGLDWALLYDKYNRTTLDTEKIAIQISNLLRDSDVQSQKGIIPYILTGMNIILISEHFLKI